MQTPFATRRRRAIVEPMKSCVIVLFTVLLAPVIAAQEPASAVETFEKLPAGPPPDSLMVIEGSWGVVEEAGNKVLELHAEPVVDAALLIGPSLKEGASVRAKAKAAKTRRAFPRFGVGLYGVSGVKLRVVPAQKKIELVQGEEVIAEAAFDSWTEGAWWLVELKVLPAGESWRAEARVWADGADAPAAASLEKVLASAPGQGRASVLGSPYANKPVQFDDVLVTDLAKGK
jgi:hypothetical protein